MFTKKWLFIVLMPCWYALHAQSTAPLITGIVKDEQGIILPDVSVKLQNNGVFFYARTNSKGIFEFSKIPYGGPYSIVFSCIGYQDQVLGNYTIIPGGLVAIDVKMKLAVIELTQTVVVGYGIAPKRDLSSAVTSLLPSDLNVGVITSPLQQLQGRVAGLNISEDGNPNGIPTIILRGPSTLNLGQQPFYVVDGVPDASLDLVSPSDIASVEVLKDASAAAIYGNRAANGVILITTRKGKPGEVKITYNAYAAIQKISSFINVATAAQLRAYLKANNKALAPTDDNGGNTDWQKEVSRTGSAQSHNLGFSGGGDKFIYSGSLNYLKDNAIIKKSSLEIFTGRFNIEQKTLNNHVKLRFSLYNTISSQSDVDTLVFYNVLRFLPTLNIYNTDGTFKEDLTRTQTYNPLALIENNEFDTKMSTTLANAGVEVTLPHNITYNLNVGYQTHTVDSNIYFNHYSLLAYNTNGEAIRSSYQDTKKVLENYFSYDYSFVHNQHLKFLLGYSWQQETNGDGFQTSNVNFASDATSYNNLGLGQAPPGYVPLYGNTFITTLRLISFYSRFNYNYNDEYLFQGTLRRDGSSAFGVNHRWGYFPSASAAWRIIKAEFMKDQHVFNDLKLRIGYGIAGNTIGFDPLTPLLLNSSTGSFYYNGSFVKSIGPVQNPNPNLEWEKTTQLDAGVDFAFLRDRLTGTIDIYNKTTTGIIYNYQQPASLSYTPGSLIYANAGEMNNKGIELSITAIPVIAGNLKWSSNFNIAHNKNEVVSLSNNIYKLNYIYTGYPDGTGQSNINTQIIKGGYPVGEFYTLHYLGKNANGVSEFEDRSGKPTITPTSADQRYLGNAQPQFVFGWNNTLNYKNFDLNIFMRGVTGNKILNATLATLNSPVDASNHNIPKLTLSESYNDYNASLYSDRYLENGSYLRLDNASLGYRFKDLGKSIRALRVYASGTNLFTLTGYNGIDPEINIGTVTPGIDNHNYYPKTRSFIVGINMEL
ncbi:iron complex outermembrane receptor protein [Mucilaginibacter frigoritolerans]|uniref:Iron complex outermembrane receptor protein n=1 Tax=Mucilaginibacter frigoritolerans TaxID=652788 RepID=A0A562TQT2_9SPHI|nr:SusC/RagA family TonB-linked outer membrane protein [Mucilaginibacter frigoritolerans]TWI95598.1 iron complex outermembrane receptor protein [Mucilaginibacter frigoritolerans]